MSKLKELIKNLSSHELAIFTHYQFDGLVRSSREILKQEIEQRKITKEQVDQYISIQLDKNGPGPFCERCGSDKLFSDIDTEYLNSQHFTTEIEVQTPRCRLCNFNPAKAAEKNIFKRIKRYLFGTYRTEKHLKTRDWFGN